MSDRTGSGTAVRPALWLDPGFGASGDMLLGALLGLGAPLTAVIEGLDRLSIDGWSVSHQQVVRGSLAADRAVVTTEEAHHHRSWREIDGLLAEADLPEAVCRGARRTFRRLGEVEAGIHRVDIDEVHFHEVGAVDAIVDIVGVWLAADALGVLGDHDSSVTCGPIGLGHGAVEAAHGRLPVPAPATAELLTGAPIHPLDVAAETITPTGAALLVTLAGRWGPIPAGRLLATARGAGTRDPDSHPNVVTAHLVDPATGPGGEVGEMERAAGGEDAAVLTTNLDDLTPELVAHAIDRCLEAGADDAWATPIVMKKGRPAIELSVLCRPADADRLRTVVFAETGTLGVRTRLVTKHPLPRRFESVTVRGQRIAIKVGPYGVKPEYADVAAAARVLEIPARELATEALAAFRARNEGDRGAEAFAEGISDHPIQRPNS